MKDGRPLYFAIDKGYKAVVEMLLSYGARTDILDSQGNKALHIAAGRGHCDSTIVLIDLDPISFTNANSKPIPQFNGEAIAPEIVQLIRAADPEVETKNSLEWTPLDYARICKSEASVILLSNVKTNL